MSHPQAHRVVRIWTRPAGPRSYRVWDADGVRCIIIPGTMQILRECVERGYITAGEDCLTGTPGIFVAGDCRTKAIRQVTTAAADGAVAALAACRYIDSL